MSRFWNQRTLALKPYVPGEQPKEKMIKLNTNENPYPPSDRVQQAMKEAADDRMRLYPDPDASALRQTFAEYVGVDEKNVFVGNGSDEVLSFAFDAFFPEDKPVLFPDVTYSFYPVYCAHLGLTYQTVPLREDFTIDPADYVGEIGGIVIANPNAPTGIALSLDEIEIILKNNPDCAVVIDEAYVRFGAESAVQLIDRYPNLLVVQTMSKSHALAGLRVGFAVGSEELIEGLNRVKNAFNSYPVDRIAQAGAIASLQDVETIDANLNTIRATREGVSVALRGIGFDVLPSSSNFIMIRYWNCPAKTLFDHLREKKILVRYFDLPRIDDYLRVTIGTKDEMRTFLDTVEDFIE